MTIRIALGDDHRLFRESLRMVLTQQPCLLYTSDAADE